MAPKSKHEKPFQSSFGLKYPTSRDYVLKSGDLWLNGKREDDGAEGLWRIHDDLYDFSDFVKMHPGGSDWLRLTKGTDITEAFEVHHISTKPEQLLQKYHVSKTTAPRNSPFTFHKDGFYKTLKAQARPIIEKMPKSSINISTIYIDAILLLTFTFSLLTVLFQSYVTAVIAGYLLSAMAIAAHNFSHRRDNFRMYYFDLTPMQTKEWRVIHILSHHMYTNTLADLEMSMYEPWFHYIPDNQRSFFVRYSYWISAPVTFMNIYLFSFFCRAYYLVFNRGEEHKPTWTDLLPYILPTFMYTMASAPITNVMFWWFVILMSSSFIFGMTGANAAHHHPELFHDGDTPRVKERDWGVMQLDSIMDRKEISNNYYLILTSYGDHALHHMFPTLDHSQLKALEPSFWDTCKKFGIEHRVSTQFELFKGTFQQLSRNTPNLVPPGVQENTRKNA